MSQPEGPAPEPDEDARKALRRATISFVAEVALLGVCGYVLARDANAALTGDVRTSMRIGAFLLNLTAAFVLVHRAMATVQRYMPDPRAKRAVGLLKWVMVLIMPLLVAFYLEQLTYKAHREHVDTLAAEVSARTARALAAQRDVAVADLQDLAGPYLRKLSVRPDTGAFLLEVALPGLDVDGYIGRYASPEGHWQIQHRDEAPAQEPEFLRLGPLLVCTRDDSATHCEAP